MYYIAKRNCSFKKHKLFVMCYETTFWLAIKYYNACSHERFRYKPHGVEEQKKAFPKLESFLNNENPR